ncbi:hypothetical protein CK203_106650 [Vitis vinifera]|uniref:Uncharacterized protein n=1 Tax=Vitis vinifera TaxID=29760 RepID=A0A438DUR2_VITVI|nr:hypothetical protein CK203_106650 [Vitis vinifera]
MASPLHVLILSAHVVSHLHADHDEVKKLLFYKFSPSNPPASSISFEEGPSSDIFSTVKMKTAIITVFVISSMLLCLQADARRLMLEEVKGARGETDVKPSLVPAKSGMNGNGVTADQVNSNSEEKNESDEASNGQGSSASGSTHHFYPDEPPRQGHKTLVP